MVTTRYGAGPAQAGSPWTDLCRRTRDAAEGFARIDPGRAMTYRRDAEAFCGRPAAADGDDLLALRHEAEELRERWARRFMDGFRRIPR